MLLKGEYDLAGKMDIRDRAKALWLRGMKAIGNTAASIANNTRYKVDEVTIQNRRREVLGDLANKAYALWLKGESFPEPMTRMLDELKQLDEQLNDMRAEKYAASITQGQNDSSAEESETDQPDMLQEEPEEEEEDLSVVSDNPSVSMEINGLFDEKDSVDRMAQKVNSSLDQMSERIRRFPQADENDGKEQD